MKTLSYIIATNAALFRAGYQVATGLLNPGELEPIMENGVLFGSAGIALIAGAASTRPHFCEKYPYRREFIIEGGASEYSLFGAGLGLCSYAAGVMLGLLNGAGLKINDLLSDQGNEIIFANYELIMQLAQAKPVLDDLGTILSNYL